MGLPAVMTDLGSSLHFSFGKANPLRVLLASQEGQPTMYINILTSVSVPGCLDLPVSTRPCLCGLLRQGKDCLVLDIVLNPNFPRSHQMTDTDAYDAINKEVCTFVGRVYGLKISVEEEKRAIVYFDHEKTIDENAAREGFNRMVMVSIPDEVLFEKYVQIPILDAGDAVKFEELPPPSSTLTKLRGVKPIRIPSIADTNMVRTRSSSDSSSSTDGLSEMSQSTSLLSHFKALTHSSDSNDSFSPRSMSFRINSSPRAGANSITGSTSSTPSLSEEEIVNFNDPAHARALLRAVSERDGMSRSQTMRSSGLRTPRGHVVRDSPRTVVTAGEEGRGLITADMLVVDRESCLDPTSARALKNQAKSNRSILVGWQLLVHSPDGRTLKGVYVVTGQRKSAGLQLYRLSNFEEPDQWVPLSRSTNSKGFTYLPLRQVFGN